MKNINRIVIGIAVIFSSCMSTKKNSVDQAKYLGTNTNSSSIYNDTISNCFYSPLNMTIDPMEKLMIIDFDNDSIYETIELQIYNDIRGKGATVILYKKKGGIDVYYTDSAFVNKKLFQDCLFENKEIKYNFNMFNTGIDASVELKDKFGRVIAVKIKELNNIKSQKSFLAPVGGIIETFTFFPLFYMKSFNFVKSSGTTISIQIANRYLKAKKIPILLNGSFVYLSRYSNEPVICSINDKYNGVLKPMIPTVENKWVDGDITYSLINNGGHFEIKKVSCNNTINNVAILFSPAIPDLVNLKNGITIDGKFSIEIDSITGIVAGAYKLSRINDEFNFTMNPLEAYSPMSGPLWVLAYKWNADITITENGIVNVNSKWIKSKNI